MEWNLIWHQAMTVAAAGGQTFIGRTTRFSFTPYQNGKRLRLRFCNHFGQWPYDIGGVVLLGPDGVCQVTVKGAYTFSVAPGEWLISDELSFSVQAGKDLEVRIFTRSAVRDVNAVEEWACALPGDHLRGDVPQIPLRRDPATQIVLFTDIPALSSIEVLTEQRAGVIVAFGDSITAMNRWVKPLAKRLYDAYGPRFTLVNSGISGNSMTFERTDEEGICNGAMGVRRFARDVLAYEPLHAVILALGINDLSYMSQEWGNRTDVDKLIQETSGLLSLLKHKGVRRVLQTVTPRKGFHREFTDEMERMRQEYNLWVRTKAQADYIIDADACLRDQDAPSQASASCHQGDYLHPNAFGGQKLADAYDLERLTGTPLL